MKNTRAVIYIIGLIVLFTTSSSAQTSGDDSVKFEYRKIYSFCLDANVTPVLSNIETGGSKKLSARDQQFKADFEARFKYEVDKSSFLAERRSGIDSLLALYQRYWRIALLNTNINYDSAFAASIHDFIRKNYLPAANMVPDNDSLDVYLKKYIQSNHLYTTGFGKTGKLYDLLVWKTEKDTVYSFTLGGEKLTPSVVFMDDFITLGWEEYASLGKFYPGGWTTPKALYCVKKAYDLNSENFLISYLAHEGRHFADTKLFPDLSSPDLEYRAKLVELSLADKTLHDLVNIFIATANYDSENGHSVAAYCVIRDLSKAIFHIEFEKDKDKWQTISREKINSKAAKILALNTKALRIKGKHVKKYIKP